MDKQGEKMDKKELVQKLQDIEWENFEVKEAVSEVPKNAWETVSAFSNTAGGWLVFGVSKMGKQYEILGVRNPVRKEGVEKVTEKVTENQERIITAMRENPRITVVELKDMVNISRKSILENIAKLKEKGLLQRIGPDKGGHGEIIQK